jgi:Arc/MetJ-type ribon-helix-helix transcriptional regulator
MVSLRLTEEEILELDRRIGFDGMRNRSDVLRRGLHKLLDETASPDAGRRITIRVGTVVAQQLQLLQRMAELDASSAAGLGIALLLEQKTAEMRAVIESSTTLLEEVEQRSQHQDHIE